METINHEYYVSLEVAKLLKETGFDWEVNTCRYNSSPDKISSNGTLTSNFNGYAFQHIAVSAPTLDVAQRWLREVKDYDVFVVVDDSMEYAACIFHNKEDEDDYYECYKTYEKAQEAGIKKALEIILEKEE